MIFAALLLLYNERDCASTFSPNNANLTYGHCEVELSLRRCFETRPSSPAIAPQSKRWCSREPGPHVDYALSSFRECRHQRLNAVHRKWQSTQRTVGFATQHLWATACAWVSTCWLKVETASRSAARKVWSTIRTLGPKSGPPGVVELMLRLPEKRSLQCLPSFQGSFYLYLNIASAVQRNSSYRNFYSLEKAFAS